MDILKYYGHEAQGAITQIENFWALIEDYISNPEILSAAGNITLNRNLFSDLSDLDESLEGKLSKCEVLGKAKIDLEKLSVILDECEKVTDSFDEFPLRQFRYSFDKVRTLMHFYETGGVSTFFDVFDLFKNDALHYIPHLKTHVSLLGFQGRQLITLAKNRYFIYLQAL